MRNDLGNVRRSQVITNYGPGAIVDFRAGSHGGAGISIIAAGLEQWDERAQPAGLAHPQVVSEPRLQKKLGVDGFRLPPVAPQVRPGVYQDSGRLVGARFPRWLQCPKCHLLKLARDWTFEMGDPASYCPGCTEQAGGRNRAHVIPVRFLVICENGHIDEFPWGRWVRHKPDCAAEDRKLKLVGGATAGLAGLVLSCLQCGESRPMEGCFARREVVTVCQGRSPWLGSDAVEPCTAEPIVVQRGASNLYFSVVDSALEIPPWSDNVQKRIGAFWGRLMRADTAEKRRDIITVNHLHELARKSVDALAALVEEGVTRLNAPDRNLRWEEYQQFVSHKAPFGENTEFEIRPALAPPEMAQWLEAVTRATRLREVRALRGFTRVQPPEGPDDARIAKLSRHRLRWLPAVENRGEGIFVQLRTEQVRTWEAQPEVIERVERVRARYQRAWRDRGRAGSPTKVVTPRFMLVHSLAHVLIRQLALGCGYSGASLRERLYVDADPRWDMTGLLIYTSSPDADGTLGGLARQGLPANFVHVLEEALASSVWCSSDPLCIEGVHSRTEPTNLAACHACLLAAETSCEEYNTFLDRALLVGTPANPDLGFFAGYLASLREG